MKRYRITGSGMALPTESADGHWVKYEDAEAESTRLRAENETLKELNKLEQSIVDETRQRGEAVARELAALKVQFANQEDVTAEWFIAHKRAKEQLTAAQDRVRELEAQLSDRRDFLRSDNVGPWEPYSLGDESEERERRIHRGSLVAWFARNADGTFRAGSDSGGAKVRALKDKGAAREWCDASLAQRGLGPITDPTQGVDEDA